jgi:hypothetical protein
VADLFDTAGHPVAVVDAPPCTPTIVHAGRTYTWEGGTTYWLVPDTHDHRCPTCHTVWDCPSPAGTPCANRAHNGNPVWPCQPCRPTGSKLADGESRV